MELINKKIRADRGYERGYGQVVISSMLEIWISHSYKRL